MKEFVALMSDRPSIETSEYTNTEQEGNSSQRRKPLNPIDGAILSISDRIQRRNSNSSENTTAPIQESINPPLALLETEEDRHLAATREAVRRKREESGFWTAEKFDVSRLNEYRRHSSGGFDFYTDPATGEEVCRVKNTRGGQEIRDLPENLSMTDFQEAVRARIEDLEKNTLDIAQDPGNIVRLIKEVVAYTPPIEEPKESVLGRLRRGLTGGSKPAPKSLTQAEMVELMKFRGDLREEITNRLFLALANYATVYGDKNVYEQAINNWGRDGLDYVVFKLENDPRNFQVRRAIELIETTEGGAVFRANNKAEKDRLENIIKGSLLEGKFGGAVRDIYNKKQSGGTLTPEEEAQFAEPDKWLDTTYRLANSVMNITGMTNHYGGALDKEGKLLEATIVQRLMDRGEVGFKVVGGRRLIDITNEAYWNELEKYKMENGIKRIPPMVYFRDEVAGNARRYTDPDTGKIYEMGHTNFGLFKRVFSSAEALNDAIPPNARGVFKRALIGSETRARNLAAAKGFERLTDYLEEVQTGAAGSLKIDSSKMGGGELFGWWSLIKGASDYGDKYTKWMSKPFGGSPNSLNDNPSENNVQEIFAPVIETFDSSNFDYLKRYGDIDARPEIAQMITNASEKGVKTALEWHEDKAAQGRFRWRPWNSNALSAALADLSFKFKVVQESSINNFIKTLGINWLAAGHKNGWLEAKEGFWANIDAFRKFGFRVLAESAGNLAA